VGRGPIENEAYDVQRSNRNDRVGTELPQRAPSKERRASGEADFRVEEDARRIEDPVLDSPQERRPFFFAGLWERWIDRNCDDMIESCTIITSRQTRS